MEIAPIIISSISLFLVVISIYISFSLQQRRKRKDYFYKKLNEFRAKVVEQVDYVHRQEEDEKYMWRRDSVFSEMNGAFTSTIVQCEIIRIEMQKDNTFKFTKIKYFNNAFILKALTEIDKIIAYNITKEKPVNSEFILKELSYTINMVDSVFYSLKGIDKMPSGENRPEEENEYNEF